MKKLLSLALAVMLLAGTVVVAFAEADGTPLTLDVSTLSKYIYLGPEEDYYDEDGYVLTGVKEDAGVSLYVDSNLTFSDLKILDLDTRDDAENISITIDGENEIIDRIFFRDENFLVSFLHWPIVFLGVFCLLFPLFLLGKKHPVAASRIAVFLLCVLLAFMAALFVFIIILFFNSRYHFWY